ncbi:MAG: PH domain-containing protein [Shouchella clausii]
MYFPSKKGVGMTICCFATAVVFIIMPLFFPDQLAFILPPFLNHQIVKALITLPIAFFVLWIWGRTGYTLSGSRLKIVYGPIRKTIDIHDIRTIRSKIDPFIDPALSMDKIEINYGQFETISISPKRKDEFISKLLEKNPNIKMLH